MSGELKIRIKGLDPIDVNVTRDGKFEAGYDGGQFEADTFAALTSIVAKASRRKRVKVSVPFTRVSTMVLGREGGATRWSEPRVAVQHGTATGIHGSNGNLLVRWDGSDKTEQERSYGTSNTEDLRRLSDEEAQWYEALLNQLDAAQRVVREFREDKKVKVRDLVQAEINGVTGGDDNAED